MVLRLHFGYSLIKRCLHSKWKQPGFVDTNVENKQREVPEVAQNREPGQGNAQ